MRKIAGGSVGQEFEIWREERGVGKVTWGILRFNMLFEEIFDFQLEFVECAARELHAADEGGTSDPYVNISIKGSVPPLCIVCVLSYVLAATATGRSSSQKVVSMAARYRQRRNTTHYSQSGPNFRNLSTTMAHGQSFRTRS